jgi:hypothetical protein
MKMVSFLHGFKKQPATRVCTYVGKTAVAVHCIFALCPFAVRTYKNANVEKRTAKILATAKTDTSAWQRYD